MGKPQRVALIGFGSIGRDIFRFVRSHPTAGIELIGALVRSSIEPDSETGIPFVRTLSELLSLKPDVVIEAAGHGALREHGVGVLQSGRDLLIVSIGALADSDFFAQLVEAARNNDVQLCIPSGSAGGLDAIAAASIGGLTSVTHVIRKPAAALPTTQGSVQSDAPTTVFRGNVREAASLFPKNVNVACAVGLAGVGMDDTIVHVISDTTVTRNHHEIEAEGAFGTLKISLANNPSPSNPSTSQLTSMSVIQSILARRSPIRIG